jgi:hypothetical protein
LRIATSRARSPARGRQIHVIDDGDQQCQQPDHGQRRHDRTVAWRVEVHAGQGAQRLEILAFLEVAAGISVAIKKGWQLRFEGARRRLVGETQQGRQRGAAPMVPIFASEARGHDLREHLVLERYVGGHVAQHRANAVGVQLPLDRDAERLADRGLATEIFPRRALRDHQPVGVGDRRGRIALNRGKAH